MSNQKDHDVPHIGPHGDWEGEIWHSVVANAPVFIAVVDRNGVIQFLNRAQPGYRIEEAIGKRIYDFMEPEYHRQAEMCLAKVFSTGTPAFYEALASGASGSTACYETYLGPVRQGDQTVAVSLASIDISARKEAETALQQARDSLEQEVRDRTSEILNTNEQLRLEIEYRKLGEETARALINAPTESFLLVELNGTIVTLNEAAAQWLENQVQELIGTCVYHVLPGDMAQSHMAYAEKVIQSGEPICFEEAATGRIFRSCIYPVFGANGKVSRIAVYAQDITKRKAAEVALREEQRHLRRALEASDRERRVIAYDIHDGLTQYLTAAILQFQTVSQLQSQKPRQASKYLGVGLKMLRKALSEARRLISGVRPPILDEMGIISAIEHLLNDIKSSGGLECEFDARIDFERLTPMFENAVFRIIQESLVNARTHSGSDKVRVAICQENNTLHIEVQDWGVGFDEAHLEEGGFGLESIRERARLLGGWANIDSKSGGNGTCIVVDLPLPENV